MRRAPYWIPLPSPLAVMVCLTLTTAALGQDDAQRDGLLGGPPVEVEAETPTLVERDYEGKLRELDTRAEVAAIGLLGLTDAEREAVDLLVLGRAKMVDAIVFDNLELLTQLQSARASLQPGQGRGQPRGQSRGQRGGEQRELFTKMFDMIAPLREQEPLVDHYAGALPESKREQYRAIVSEWTGAQASAAPEGMGGERRRGRTGRSGGPMAGIAGIRAELKASYERGAADRTDRLDSLIATLDLTPEQEGEVRRKITDLAQQNGGNPTQAQRAELFREILATLEPEQRRKAIERFRADRP